MRPYVPLSIGGALVALGVFLPWATAGSLLSVNGLSVEGSDGTVVLIVGALLLVLGVIAGAQGMTAATRGFGAVGAVIAGFVGVVDWVNAADHVAGTPFVSVGPGLPVIVLGAVLAFVACFLTDPAEQAEDGY